MRVVERKALRLDVAVAGPEGCAGVAVRQRGGLQPMRLLIAVAREEAIVVERLWSTFTSNWLSCRSLTGLIK